MLFDRQAYVGLKGAFGTAILGRTKNLVDGTIARVDPFNTYGVVGKNNETCCVRASVRRASATL